MGNGAFARLRDAVKTRLTAETALVPLQLPAELRSMAGERFLQGVLDIYEKGNGAVLEESVVLHMASHFVQKLAGNPHPHTSAKLFALARAPRHLHKPSYEFLRLNSLVLRGITSNTTQGAVHILIARVKMCCSGFQTRPQVRSCTTCDGRFVHVVLC